jgi:hypothetical protein
VDIGFDVISVRQMSTTRRSPDGSTNITLPLFLVTLPRKTKSPELFKHSSLCHISIKVEAYISRNTLTQCYNCQTFGHVWANCKQQTLHFNNNLSTPTVFLDIEKAFDTSWHLGLLYKLAKLQFSKIMLISSFLSQRKFRVSVEGEISTPRYMQAGVPQGSVLSSTLYNLYIKNTPKPLV